MGCHIVVGGQYGSEGKGKVVALEAAVLEQPWVVRCGGPNSGHTVTINGYNKVLRQVPAGAAHPRAMLLLSAGCAVDEDILLSELDELAVPPERIVVDPRAVIITASDLSAEGPSVDRIACTGSGTGVALMRRMSREPSVALAGGSRRLRGRVRLESVAPALHRHLDGGGEVIVEGTQGFGLSLLHGFDYPFVTSRDTTAAGFAAEVGLSPRQVCAITMVIRTFPIRVGGNSGPFKNKISWEEVQRLSGAPEPLPEFTSVTRRLRRVALFDVDSVITACHYNRPTSLAVMGIDRLDYENTGVTKAGDLSLKAITFLGDIEDRTGVPVGWVGTGFGGHEAVHSIHPLPMASRLASGR
jgi:adenylosuccinate synthase